MITLANGTSVLMLDPDLQWRDEFDWTPIEETEERGITGALIIDIGIKSGGRPITLAPPDDSAAWMTRSTLAALQVWEANPATLMTLSLRGVNYQVRFCRTNGAPIEAHPVQFIADPLPGQIGDWYLTTLRLIEV